MNIFNIDLHISVISDIKQILTKQGHNITDICMSQHAFLLNKSTLSTKIINANNWKNLDKEMCNTFYNEYKSELSNYDAFICCYPPSFAMLYEKFDKPIIIQVPIRLETPFENSQYKLKYFIDFLQNGIDNKQIIPLCNNKYDKKYCEELTNREWTHIPSLCKYTKINNLNDSKFILYSKIPIEPNHNCVVNKPATYDWNFFNNISGVIHIPYNISTMSIFEQYSGNVPLFFPTIDFLIELANKKYALTEISWTDIVLPDKKWINLADYYDNEWMPHIEYFNTFSELKNKIENINTREISNKMREFNKIREEKIDQLWKKQFNEYNN